MSVFRLRLNQELLDCASCARIIQPDKYNYKAHACPLCSRGQFYCGICMSDHSCLQVPLVHVSYSLLNDIIAHMKFKCNCKKYFPYCEFQDHRQKCQSAKYFTNRGPACVWKCTLETSFLECSKCKGLIQPPVFLLQFRDRLICSACYRPDVGTYRHCTEVEDLLQGIMVKCVACKQYLPFSTLGPHQLCDCPESKLQNIAVGLSARIKFCGEEKTKRPAVGSNSIHGKYGLEAPSEVGKTDNGAEVGNDDSSCDDSHGTSDDVLSYEDDSIDTMEEGEEVEKPETVKRVAKNAFKTPCDRKAKISTLYGQKTAQAPPKQPLQLFVPHRPVTRSRKRVLLTDGSTIDK